MNELSVVLEAAPVVRLRSTLLLSSFCVASSLLTLFGRDSKLRNYVYIIESWTAEIGYVSLQISIL